MEAAIEAITPPVGSGTLRSSIWAWVMQAPSVTQSCILTCGAQLFDAADIDKKRRVRDAQVEHRAERLGARRRPAAFGEELDGFRHVLRPRIVEGGRFHWPALRSASTMRRGVSGDSVISTPSGASASLTALAIAAGGAMAPPSPMPFWPKRV